MKKLNNQHWYSEVNYWCSLVSMEYKVPMYKVCGILSALSPRNKFDRNLTDTLGVITMGKDAKVATFGNNKTKALRILEAKNIGEVLAQFKGLKTRKFFLNIYKVLDHNVTVDVWIIRYYKKMIKTKTLTNKGYLEIEKQIQKDAQKIGVYPNEYQAHLWAKIRGAKY